MGRARTKFSSISTPRPAPSSGRTAPSAAISRDAQHSCVRWDCRQCRHPRELFGLTKDDLIDQVKDIITVGGFYDLAADGEIIFI